MSQIPPLALQIRCMSVPSSFQTNVSGNTVSIGTFQLIQKQSYRNNQTYDMTHLRRGDWVVGTGDQGAPCWRIYGISGTPTTSTTSQIDILLEDVGNYNKQVDHNGIGGLSSQKNTLRSA